MALYRARIRFDFELFRCRNLRARNDRKQRRSRARNDVSRSICFAYTTQWMEFFLGPFHVPRLGILLFLPNAHLELGLGVLGLRYHANVVAVLDLQKDPACTSPPAVPPLVNSYFSGLSRRMDGVSLACFSWRLHDRGTRIRDLVFATAEARKMDHCYSRIRGSPGIGE